MTSEMQELFSQAITGDYENENAWEAVHALHTHGSTEIFNAAAAWIKSEAPLNRARAADILAQLREPEGSAGGLAAGGQIPQSASEEPLRLFRDESVALIVEMLKSETESLVLAAAITALGHLRNEAGIPVILNYLRYPDLEVRFAAAFALGCLPDEPAAISGLLELTKDEHSDVRDWAVFGLGVKGSADSADIRAALLECLGSG